MATQDIVLDEIQWRAPDWVQHMGGIHENTVLHYFAQSPFFDQTSNNASIATQAIYNPAMAYILETRDSFEQSLRSLSGLEFMVVLGPKDFGGEAPIGEGQWVIRKQTRRKRAGGDDELTILADYFVIGENVYMAPSINNILGSKLLSMTSALNQLFATASTLPKFTPALGNRYFAPTVKAPSFATESQSTQQSARDATPSVTGTTQAEKAKGMTTGITQASAQPEDVQTLFESFGQFLRYRNEYMDENPLVGEPGAFVFSSSKQHLQTQQQQAAAKLLALKPQNQVQETATPQTSAPATPQPQSDALPPRKASKGNDGPSKPRRRKSKAPRSPSSALSTAAPSPS